MLAGQWITDRVGALTVVERGGEGVVVDLTAGWWLWCCRLALLLKKGLWLGCAEEGGLLDRLLSCFLEGVLMGLGYYLVNNVEPRLPFFLEMGFDTAVIQKREAGGKI